MKESTAKGKIVFEDCYSLYKFIEALNMLTDEIPLIVDSYNNELILRFMDVSRICLIETTFSQPTNINTLKNLLKGKKNDGKNIDIIGNHYSINIQSSGKQSIDINDLKNILKVKKVDEKIVTIVFEDPYKLLIEKKARSLGIIKKNLAYLNVEFDDINMNTLDRVEYPAKVIIKQKLLNDFFYESGIYSEVIGIEINEDGIHFTEDGVIGDSDTFYESNLLNVHNITTKSEKAHYSLSFLNLVKPIVGIMEENDVIKFELKTDHPLKVSIKFVKIGAEIIYYLACRVEEADYEEPDEEF